jgi:vacuolar-type H+-ATPase subunit E/Vma4
MLMSPEITIEHQKSAESFISKAGDAALKKYNEISGRESKITYEAEIPDEAAGGVVGSIMKGQIKVDNTLDERLKILEEQVCRGASCISSSKSDWFGYTDAARDQDGSLRKEPQQEVL